MVMLRAAMLLLAILVGTAVHADAAPTQRSIQQQIDVLGNLTVDSDTILNRKYVPLRNCKEIYDFGLTQTGLYVVQPSDNGGEFVVYCDMDIDPSGTGHRRGWTVIQRRVDGSLEFDRPWDCYKSGFGDFTKNFWLGLEKMKRLTNYCSEQGNAVELYIGLENCDGDLRSAKYSTFRLGDEENNYRLTIEGFSGDAGNSLAEHNGEAFSTTDSDNDSHRNRNCANRHKGGWWFKKCLDSNLNGKWHEDCVPNQNVPDGIMWETWTGTYESLKTVVMAIRPAH